MVLYGIVLALGGNISCVTPDLVTRARVYLAKKLTALTRQDYLAMQADYAAGTAKHRQLVDIPTVTYTDNPTTPISLLSSGEESSLADHTASSQGTRSSS